MSRAQGKRYRRTVCAGLDRVGFLKRCVIYAQVKSSVATIALVPAVVELPTNLF